MRDFDEGVFHNGNGGVMNLARKSTDSMINLKSIQSKNKTSFNVGREKSQGQLNIGPQSITQFGPMGQIKNIKISSQPGPYDMANKGSNNIQKQTSNS